MDLNLRDNPHNFQVNRLPPVSTGITRDVNVCHPGGLYYQRTIDLGYAQPRGVADPSWKLEKYFSPLVLTGNWTENRLSVRFELIHNRISYFCFFSCFNVISLFIIPCLPCLTLLKHCDSFHTILHSVLNTTKSFLSNIYTLSHFPCILLFDIVLELRLLRTPLSFMFPAGYRCTITGTEIVKRFDMHST